MAKIEPTIGRVVWFWPDPGLGREDGLIDKTKPWSASIVYVHPPRLGFEGEDLINVAGYKHNGRAFFATDIPIVQEQAEHDGMLMPHAQWMPYQKGQAAKTEALEKAVQDGFRAV